ncbi:YSIRK-type signal peptide-containing protein, partial [Staphylococcus haemolyticus]
MRKLSVGASSVVVATLAI